MDKKSQRKSKKVTSPSQKKKKSMAEIIKDALLKKFEKEYENFKL